MAYSYHDWASNPLDSSSIEKSGKKKSGLMGNIKKFFTKSERPVAKNKTPARASSNPDIADNYGRQFGQGIHSKSDHVSSDFNPNSFFSGDGVVDKFKNPKISPIPKRKLPPSSSPAFEIPEYHKQNRPSLDNIFDIKKEKNITSNRVPRSRKQESSSNANQYESPMELLGGPSIVRHHSSGSSDWRVIEGHREKKGRRYERRPSLEASVGKSCM